MALLDAVGASVARLIDTFGGSVTVTIPGATHYHPVIGESRTGADTTQTVKGVVERDSDSLSGGGKDAIRAGDERLGLASKVTIKAAGLTRVPQPGDEIMMQGKPHNVIRVEGIVSGDNVAAYTLQVRG